MIRSTLPQQRSPIHSSRRKHWRLAIGALLALYVVIYVLSIGVRPLASPDEVRYGEISREIIATGDWISPHLNGVRYFEKTPLGYWLNAASLAAFGQTPFALRLPVALATGLAALIVFGLARRFLTRFAAWLAAAIFLTTFLVAGAGTFAVLDAFFALFLTAALASYYLGIEEPEPRRRHAWLALCGAACGAAFLVKGFIAFAIPVIVALPFLVVYKRWRALLASPWLPIFVAAIVILPWAIAIQIREPDFWHYFFWVEHVQRFAGSNAQHAEPVWYYIAYLPLTGWPWIFLLPAALVGLWHGRRTTTSRASADGGLAETAKWPSATVEKATTTDTFTTLMCFPDPSASATVENPTTTDAPPASHRQSSFLWYCAAWAALPLIFFSIAKGKLPTYLLPCFAPLAIILAAGLESYVGQGRQALSRCGTGVIALAFIAVLCALAAGQMGAFDLAPFGTDETAKAMGFAVCMAVGACSAVFACFWRTVRWRIAAIVVAGAATILPLQLAMPQRVLDNMTPSTVVSRYAPVPENTLLISDGALFGTVAWVFKRDDVYVLNPGEIDYGLKYADSRDRLLTNDALTALIKTNHGQRAILIICEDGTANRIAGLMPPDALLSRHGKIFVWRIPSTASAAAQVDNRNDNEESLPQVR